MKLYKQPKKAARTLLSNSAGKSSSANPLKASSRLSRWESNSATAPLYKQPKKAARTLLRTASYFVLFSELFQNLDATDQRKGFLFFLDSADQAHNPEYSQNKLAGCAGMCWNLSGIIP